MARETCGTCRFYREQACREGPPQVATISDGRRTPSWEPRAAWPPVPSWEWCGRWAARRGDEPSPPRPCDSEQV